MRTPLTSECLKGPGYPPDIDLRECPKWPNHCPLVYIKGENIILEQPQKSLFEDSDIEE